MQAWLFCAVEPTQAQYCTQSHKHWTEANNHLPHPAGYTLANTTQHVIGLLCFEDKQSTDVQFFIKQGAQVFFCRTTFHPVCPHSAVTAWINSMPGTGLHTCLPLPSWFEFFLTPPLYPGWETQVNVIGIWNFQERDRVKERCNSLFSQLCNQGILSHNMTILLKKKMHAA